MGDSVRSLGIPTKLGETAAVLLIIAILLDSPVFVAAAQGLRSSAHSAPAQEGSYRLVSVSGSGPPWSSAGLEDATNQTTRELILAYVVANPGVYLRELAEDLDFSMGVVQYHIWALSKDGRVEDCRTGRFRRFFGAGRYQEVERRVISLLKQGTAGRIILLLSRGELLTHANLARILGISSQALSWQIGRLRTMGVVRASGFQGRTGKTYSLPECVSEVVSQYLQREQPSTASWRAIDTTTVLAHVKSVASRSLVGHPSS